MEASGFLSRHPKFANAIGEIGKVIAPMCQFASNIPGCQVLGTIGNAIDKVESISDEHKAELKDVLKSEMAEMNELEGLILGDTSDARKMNVAIDTSDKSKWIDKVIVP